MNSKVLWLSVTLSACATVSPEPQAVSAGPAVTVATWNSGAISQTQADANAKADLLKVNEQLYEIRADSAERLALQAMVQQAAAKENLSEDEWLHKKVGAAPLLAEPELRRLFERLKKRLPEGTTFEEAREQLQDAAAREDTKQRMGALFEELKAQNNFKIVLLPPERPRKMVSSVGPARGPTDAKITIVEFADFQCPYCSRAARTVERVAAAYPQQVRVVFRHYPLSFHPLAPAAARASVCADNQGHFWEFHDALFGPQSDLEVSGLMSAAASVKLDKAVFEKCLGDPATQKRVDADLLEGKTLGVDGTPAFFVNGMMLSGARPEADFRKLIDAELLRLGAH